MRDGYAWRWTSWTCLGGYQAISAPVQCLDDGYAECVLDLLAQPVDMGTQGMDVGFALAPYLVAQLVVRDEAGVGPDQGFEYAGGGAGTFKGPAVLCLDFQRARIE